MTYQTGAEGQPIRQVLVTVGHDIARELYLGLAIDRALQCPVLMAIDRGRRRDREGRPRDAPRRSTASRSTSTPACSTSRPARSARSSDFEGDTAKKGAEFFKAFVRMFLDFDASLAEINPLIVTDSGDVLALDCKLNFDDNALFRHPDVAALLDPHEEDPNELRAAKCGLSYVQLDGDIACLVNGAGLAMSTMDLIKYHGGEPANFLDVGGGASKDQVLEGFRILLASPKVKAVLVNIFGGIMKCDIIASALLAAYDELDFRVPLVVRLEGTNVEQGMKLLEESGRKIITAKGLTDAAQKVVAAAQGAA